MSDTAKGEWLYLRGGQQTGPVTLAELQRLAAAGQLQPQDNVWKAGMAQWASAQTIPGLFASPPPPPPPMPPPPPTANIPAVAAVPVWQASGVRRMAILIMTILAAFFSVFVGGCTASMGEGLAKFGDNVSDLQKIWAVTATPPRRAGTQPNFGKRPAVSQAGASSKASSVSPGVSGPTVNTMSPNSSIGAREPFWSRP